MWSQRYKGLMLSCSLMAIPRLSILTWPLLRRHLSSNQLGPTTTPTTVAEVVARVLIVVVEDIPVEDVASINIRRPATRKEKGQHVKYVGELGTLLSNVTTDLTTTSKSLQPLRLCVSLMIRNGIQTLELRRMLPRLLLISKVFIRMKVEMQIC